MTEHHSAPDGGLTIVTRDMNGKLLGAFMPEETTRYRQRVDSDAATKQTEPPTEGLQADEPITVGS